MEHSTNTKLVSVLMVVSKLGDNTIGILMHPLWCRQASNYSSFLLRFTALNPRVLTLYLHFCRLTLTFRFTWSFQRELIQLTFQTRIDATMFWNLTKASMDSSKLVIIGLKNFVKDWSIATSFKVRLTSAFSFEKIALFSLMLTIALSFERQWQMLIWLFHHYKQATKISSWLINVVLTNILGCWYGISTQ